MATPIGAGVVTFMTEVTSNTATASLVLNLAGAVLITIVSYLSFA